MQLNCFWSLLLFCHIYHPNINIHMKSVMCIEQQHTIASQMWKRLTGWETIHGWECCALQKWVLYHLTWHHCLLSALDYILQHQIPQKLQLDLMSSLIWQEFLTEFLNCICYHWNIFISMHVWFHQIIFIHFPWAYHDIWSIKCLNNQMIMI